MGWAMSKKPIFPLLATFIFATSMAAQPSSDIRGRVINSSTGEPLAGANIVLPETGHGDASDSTGVFALEKVPSGTYEISVSLVGYKPHRQQVAVLAGEPVYLLIKLSPTVIHGAEVIIEEERADDIRLKYSPPAFTLKPAEVAELPGAQQDVMRSLPTLPGVVAASDFSNQFIVQGGEPDENLILLDDIEIYNPYRSNGAPGFVNPFIVQDVQLYAGGYPALFGDRLSAVLAIRTREGLRSERLAGRLSASLLEANLVLEGALPLWDGSWLVSGRRSHYDLFGNYFTRRLSIFNDVAAADFEELQSKVVLRPTGQHKIQIQALHGRNRMDWLVRDDLATQDEQSLDGDDVLKNTAVAASWHYFPSNSLQTKLYANWHQLRGHTAFAGNLIPDRTLTGATFSPFGPPPPVFGGADTVAFDYDQQFRFTKITLGHWWVVQSGSHVLEGGGGVDVLKNDLRADLDLNQFGEVVFDALRASPNWFGALNEATDQVSNYERWFAYVQDKYFFLRRRGFVQGGVRFERFGINGENHFSPRVNVGFEIDAATRLSAAYGVYRQSPGYEKLLDGGQVFDVLQFTNLEGLRAATARHYVLNLNRDFGEAVGLRLSGYLKQYEDLVVQEYRFAERVRAVYVGDAPAKPGSYVLRDQPILEKTAFATNDGPGRATGFDVRLEKKATEGSELLSGWLSYSLSFSKREQAFGQQKHTFWADFDRRHTLNLFLNLRLNRHWNIGVTWNYGSGFPYIPALRAEPLVAKVAPDSTKPDELEDVVLTDPETGFVRFIPDFGGPENINSARLPDYHRLDARITFRTEWLNSQWEFFVDLINLYNRKNVLYFRNVIKIEGNNEDLPPSLRFPKPVLFREPVFMYPFLPSLGFSVRF